MSNFSPEELGRKMDALGLWDVLLPYNWVVKPAHTAFPYFCTILKGDASIVKMRFLMLEGWQTFHDYIRTRIDRNFGFYSTPMEMAHYELVVAMSGEVAIFRHDPGYMPRPIEEREKDLCAKILWEAYGVMMRVEADRQLPLKFASEKSMFARIEDSSGQWIDTPLAIPEPRAYVEEISIPKALIAKAKDLPFDANMTIELDFALAPNVMTKEPRPRCAYQLIAVDVQSGARVIFERTSISPEGGLKAMWLSMPVRVLSALVTTGRIPGRIKVNSARVFRMLRPLCIELPIKLSLHDKFERLT